MFFFEEKLKSPETENPPEYSSNTKISGENENDFNVKSLSLGFGKYKKAGPNS